MAELLKRWNDWSAGIGHLIDDGQTPGMYYSSGLLGLRGELRPVPFFNVSDINEGTASITWTFSSDGFAATAIAVEPAAFGTAVAIQSSGVTSSSGTGSTTLTYSHVVDAETNSVLFVSTHTSNGTVSGVTYDGNALTKVDNSNLTSGTNEIELWYKVAPGAGTANVVVTTDANEDMVSGAITYDNVDQENPFLPVNNAARESSAAATTVTCKVNGSADGIMLGFIVVDTANPAGDATELFEETQTLYGNGQSKAITAGGNHYQYFLEEPASSDATVPFLYATRGLTDESVEGVYTRKIILSNTNFGLVHPGAHKFNSTQKIPGQPARYAGEWYWPAFAGTKPIELTTVGTADISGDTISTVGSASSVGGDHLGNLGSQLATARDGSGYAILKVAGAPLTDGDWGSFFEVADLDERPTGVASLQGLSFVLTKEGLFSFNKRAGSGQVFEDFRSWRNLFSNVHMKAWRGGLAIPHPSGLIWYTPGELPQSIGLARFASLGANPQSGVTELASGRYISIAPAGDFLYGIYQPDLSSTSSLIVVGYGDVLNPIWQVLGTTTMQDADIMLGCHVAVSSQPDSANYVTPTFWCGNGPDLGYFVLDHRASPFRSRAQTHKVTTSAEAWLSELIFTEPVDLKELIVVASEDMTTGDEWKISMVANGRAKEETLGYVKAKGRKTLAFDRKRITRMSLHVEFTGTSAAARVPPTIKEISLFGDPSVGEARQ